jgi:hypothetical protein
MLNVFFLAQRRICVKVNTYDENVVELFHTIQLRQQLIDDCVMHS